MQQRIHAADVAIDHMHAAVRQRPEHDGIEVDHRDLFEHRRIAAFDLAQQRARGAEKTENDDLAGFAMPALVSGIGGVAVVQIAKADPLQRADQATGDLIAARHHERAQHRQDHESKRSRARGIGLDMSCGNAGLDHDQRELGDLSQIDRRQQAGAQTLVHQVQRRKCRHHAADHREGRDQQRQSDHGYAGNGYGHAERDKEQRDEEIAQRRHLGGDIERIGEGRQRNARHQRAHFARQLQPFGDLADQETPGQRAQQNQFRPARDLVEQPRQHIAAQHQSGCHQHPDPAD